jgi:hypothetical protein
VLPAWGLTTHGTPDAQVEMQAYVGDFASGYVAEGCLPTVVGGSLQVPPCRAYALETAPVTRLRYLAEPTARSIPLVAADGLIWLAGRADVAVTPPGWTGVVGTHYVWTHTTTTRPVLPQGTVLLAGATSSGGVLSQVADLRPDTPYRGPVNALSGLYGVTGDCQTVDTAGLQAAINAGLWRDREVYLPTPPGGCYKTGALWLHYHATFNAAAPQAIEHQGYLLVLGDGPMRFKTATEPRQYERTVLECVDATQPCINAFTGAGAGAPNALRHLRLERLSVVGTSPGQYLVSIDGANNGAGMREMYLLQKSQTGSGLKWLNTFVVDLTQVFIEYQSVVPQGRSTGRGLYLSNTTTTGGMVDVRNVSAKGFDTCWQIGEQDFGTGSRLQAVTILDGQAGNCQIGMFVGHALRGFSCTGCYFEGISKYAMQFDADPRGGRVEASWFAVDDLLDADDVAILFGNGVGDPGGRAQAITFANNVFLGQKAGYTFYVDTSTDTHSIAVEGNYVEGGLGASGLVGIGCRDTFDAKGLRVMGNFFDPATVATPIQDACYYTGLITAMDRVVMGRTVSHSSGAAIVLAPTLTLPTDGNTFNLTGSATVTMISCPHCRSGAQVRFLKVAGNTPVFQEGGNMNLSNAGSDANTWAPGTVATGTLTLELYGTTWYEVGRTVQ